MASFVHGYNHVHRHTGIGLDTAAGVHYGLAAGKATQRSAVLATAREMNPERFSSTRDPKILTIPDAAWINRPAAKTETEPTEAEQAA